MKKLIALCLALVMIFALAACGNTGSSDAAAGGTTGSSGGDETTDSADTAECGTAGDTMESQAEPKALRVGTLDATDNFDPCSNSDCGLGIMMVYDTVLKLDYDTMEPEPCLATDWQWSDDGMTLSLTIREGVKFSNGDELTPSDVLYSLSRFVYENDQFDPGYDCIDFENAAVEGNVLTLPLLEKDADLLLELANDRWASVVDESYVAEHPDSWWDAPCGTGPYTCVENIDGSHSTYARRDDYWGTMPDADTVTIYNYSESTTLIADFENGELDIALDVSENDYLSALDGAYGDDVQTAMFQTWDLLAICLPQYMECFQDIRVREAISLALDMNAITNVVCGSLGTVADSILIQGCDYYTPIGVHEYDPERAMELLDEAGYGDGALDLTVVIPSMKTNDKCAEILQEYLRQVGISVSVESYDFATAIPILMANGTDLSIFGTGGGTYTAKMITTTLGETSTNGGARVEDEAFNEPLRIAGSSTDSAVRMENYTAAAQWAYDNYWTLPVCYAQAVDLYHGNISNVTGLTARAVDLCAVQIG